MLFWVLSSVSSRGCEYVCGTHLCHSVWMPVFLLLLSVHPADRPQSGFLVHGNRIPQISSQPTRRLCPGHLCPQWSGKNKTVSCWKKPIRAYWTYTNSCFISDKTMFADICVLPSMLTPSQPPVSNDILACVWPQKLFAGKDLEKLKQTAKTQFGQVGLSFLFFSVLTFTSCIVL